MPKIQSRPRHVLPAFWGVVALSLTVAAWLAVAPAVNAKSLQAPGSSVVIDLPDGFRIAERFLGFQHPSGASVVIIEAPAFAYDRMRPGMTPARLRTRGVLDIQTIDLGRTDKHVALVGRQPTAVVTVQKLILLVGNDRVTTLLSANLPLRDGETVSPMFDAVKTAFANARLADKPAPRKFGFDLAYTGPFKEGEAIGFGGRIYSLTGKLPRGPVKQASPNVVVGTSFDRVTRGDQGRTLARTMVSQILRDYKQIDVSPVSDVTIDGLNGYLHRATGVWTQTGEEMVVLHYLLIEPAGGYVRIFATTPAKDAARYEPEFRKMAESFQRTQK